MKDPKNLKAILLQSFREESVELIATINQGFEAFRKAQTPEAKVESAKDIYRACHSLKGASRAVEQPELEGLSALLEEKFRKASNAKTCGFSDAHSKVLDRSLLALKILVETDQIPETLGETMEELEKVKAQAPAPVAAPVAKAAAPVSLKEKLMLAFKEESQEVMTELRSNWTSLKQASGPSQVKELSQEIFRMFHTLKGGARAVEFLEVETLSQALEEKFRAISRHASPALSQEAQQFVDQGIDLLEAGLPGGPGADSDALSGLVEKIESIKIQNAASVAPTPSKPKLDPRTIVVEAFREEQEPLMQELEGSLAGAMAARQAKESEACLQVACRAAHSLKGASRAIELPELETLSSALEETLRKALKKKTLFFPSDSKPPIQAALGLLKSHVEHFIRGTAVPAQPSVEEVVLKLESISLSEAPASGEASPVADSKTTTTLGAARLAWAQDKVVSRRLSDLQNRLYQQAQAILQAQTVGVQITDSLQQLQADGQILKDSAGDLEMRAASEKLATSVLLQLEQLRKQIHGLDVQLGDLGRYAQEDADLFCVSRLEVNRLLALPENISRRALLIRSGTSQYLVPSDAIAQVIGLQELTVNDGQATIDGEVVTLVQLPGTGASGKFGAVLKQGGRTALLTMDDLGAVQEICVQQPGWPLEKVPGYEGFSVVNRRQAVPVIDIEHLLKNVGSTNAEATATGGRQVTRVLLVDDSLTSRQLLRAVLEGGGYEVEATIHGQQAYDTLVNASADFDILVSDVEMPKMTGLELVAEVRKLDRYANFPIVLVSTLDSPEHRKTGIDAGADAYVGKGDFNSTILVDTIEELLAAKESD